MSLEILTKNRDALLQEVKSLEGRIGEKVTAVEAKAKEGMDKLDTKWCETVEELRGVQKALEEKDTKYTEELKKIQDYTANLEKSLKRPDFLDMDGKARDMRTIGQVLTESDQFKSWMDKKGGVFQPVDIKQSLWVHQDNFEKKDIIGTTAADLRDVLSTLRLQQIFFDPLRPDRVRDLIPTITTTMGLVEYLREVEFTNNAAAVAEGATKPQSDVEINSYGAQMRTLAHAITVPRQLLEDVPAFRAYLDMRLFDGLKIVEDDQLLYGSGTGANIQGLTTVTGIQEFDAAVNGDPDDTKIDTLRRAMTLSQLAFYPVSGIVVHPMDWQAIELTKDLEGRYIWVNVQTGGTPMLWRVPVVITTAINEGEALLGAFNKGTIVWDKQMANLRISEHHANVFLENRIVILVEERLCQTPILPRAFVNVLFNPTGS